MRVALPVSSGRISAVLDFARRLVVIEFEGRREVSRREVELDEQLPLRRARRLQSLGVERLICGAISRSLAEHFEDAGIEVIPLVSGSVEEVLAAHANGELDQMRFLMPGCTAEQRKELKQLRPQNRIPTGESPR